MTLASLFGFIPELARLRASKSATRQELVREAVHEWTQVQGLYNYARARKDTRKAGELTPRLIRAKNRLLELGL